jgi:hypothetical protein
MKISKISLAILILICAVGIVAASELPDFKLADGYNDLGNGSYTNEAKNIELDIISGKNIEDLDDYFENDSDVKHTTTPGKLNNTFNFTDGVNEVVGIDELVKINDTSYVIEFWINSNETVPLDNLYDALDEFNKLNNLEPLDPSILDD